MKIIKYNLCTRVNHGTDESPNIEEILTPVKMGWNEANEAIAKREAHNGEYEIINDGQPDPTDSPTQLDMIEAQVTYTALMTDTLLAEYIEDEEDITEDESDMENSTTSNTDIIDEESGIGETNTESNDNIIDGEVINDIDAPTDSSTNTDTIVIEDTDTTVVETDSNANVPVEDPAEEETTIVNNTDEGSSVEGDVESESVTEGDSAGEEVIETPIDSGSESEGIIPVEKETVVEETLVEDQVDVVEEEVGTDV